jgi:hypothetical protein
VENAAQRISVMGDPERMAKRFGGKLVRAKRNCRLAGDRGNFPKQFQDCHGFVSKPA